MSPVPHRDVASTIPISAVNYRGSLGFGQASIECLQSRVGEQDVADTQVRSSKQVLTVEVLTVGC